MPILIWQYLSSSQKESAPIGASLFILTVLLRDIVRSRSAPIGADFDMTISLIITEGIGTNWCRLFDLILTVLLRDIHRRKIGTNGCLFIYSHNAHIRDIVRSRSAPIGCRFWYDNISHYHRRKSAPIGASLFILTVLLRLLSDQDRHQLVPILISHNLTLQLKWRGTNWCRFWFDNISHYNRRKSAPNGASLFILTVLLRDIVRSR